MSRRSTRRANVIEELMREARRTGSVGSLHGRAAADLGGMGLTDFECVDVLDWTGPITAGELARRVGITSGAVTGAIDRLEKLGLVRRTADPSDRRKVIVQLADFETVAALPGQQALARCFGALAAEMDEVNDRFDDDQLAAIAEWLRAANEAVERSTERMRAAKRDG